MGYTMKKAGPTVTVSASTTSATSPVEEQGEYAWVVNASAAIAFVMFANSAPTATAANGMPVPAASGLLIQRPRGTDVAVLLSAGTGNVYVTPVNVRPL